MVLKACDCVSAVIIAWLWLQCSSSVTPWLALH